MDSDDIGKIGETNFATWCSIAGYSVNFSYRSDMTGWDCSVETKQMIQNTSDNRPEMQYDGLQYSIQIKTTASGSRKWPIRFDHLYRQAKLPNPVFICLIDIDKDSGEINSVYLVHLWEDLIKKILKRARKKFIEDKGFNGTITVHFTEQDRLDEPYPKSLKEKFETILEEGTKRYAAAKQRLLDTVGYKNGDIATTISFTVKKDNMDDLIGLTLGLKKEVRVPNIEEIDHRFELPFSTHHGPAIITEMSFTRTVDATLSFVNDIGMPLAIERATFMMSGLDVQLNNGPSRSSFISPLFRIDFQMSEFLLTIMPGQQFDELFTAKEFLRFNSLLNKVHQSSQIDIYYEHEKKLSIPVNNMKQSSFQRGTYLFFKMLVDNNMGHIHLRLEQCLNQHAFQAFSLLKDLEVETNLIYQDDEINNVKEKIDLKGGHLFAYTRFLAERHAVLIGFELNTSSELVTTKTGQELKLSTIQDSLFLTVIPKEDVNNVDKVFAALEAVKPRDGYFITYNPVE